MKNLSESTHFNMKLINAFNREGSNWTKDLSEKTK